MKAQSPTRVFVVADTGADARKLVQFFRESAGFALVGFGTPAGRLRFGAAVDVLVVQVGEPGQLAGLSSVTVPILYLVPPGETRIRRLNNASAVLRRDASSAQVRAAAAALAAGLQVEPMRIIASHSDHEADFTLQEPLTDREIRVLNLLAEGLTNPEIARRLGISRNTVKFHVSSIIAKLGAASRTEAVTLGMKRGLIIV
jgi:DNA-binding CsgD family transcriptional regulator